MKRLAIILALMGGPVGAQGYSSFLSGNDLFEYCRAGGGNPTCLAYVAGAIDGIGKEFSRMTGATLFCFPENATVRQVADVVLKYLEENPAERSDPAAEIVHGAVHEAFPCE